MELAEKVELICKMARLQQKLPAGAFMHFENKREGVSAYLFATHPEAGSQLVASGYSEMDNAPLGAFLDKVEGYCNGSFAIVAKQQGYSFAFTLEPVA